MQKLVNFSLWFLLMSVFGLQAAAQMANPRLGAVYPMGGQAGTSFQVSITNAADFDEAQGLYFSHPGITGKPEIGFANPTLPEPITSWNIYKVTIDKNVPEGIYEVRVMTRFGMSTARSFVVTHDLQHAPSAKPVDRTKPMVLAANQSVNAVIDGETRHYYQITAKKDQRLVFETYADRIDSRFEPVIQVYDPAGRELVFKTRHERRDAIVDFKAPQDGTYLLAVRDITYRGGNEYFYHLKIHAKPFVFFALPNSGLPGQTSKVKLFGRNLPDSKPAQSIGMKDTDLEFVEVDVKFPANVAPTGQGVQPLSWQAEMSQNSFNYRWASPAGLSNEIKLGLASASVVVESDSTPGKPQLVNLPVEVSGQFYPRHDRDDYLFSGKKGQVLRVEVYSHRIGEHADPSLLIQRITKDKAGTLKASDIAYVDDARNGFGGKRFDAGTTDPIHTITLPEDGEYRVTLRDLDGSVVDDPARIYRLVIREQKPDFLVIALPYVDDFAGVKTTQNAIPWSSVLRQGGAEQIDFMVLRTEGFTDEIIITADQLPEGVSANPVVIPGWASHGSMVLQANKDAKPSHGKIKLVAKGKVGGREIIHEVQSGQVVRPLQVNVINSRSRITQPVLSVTNHEKQPFNVSITGAEKVKVAKGGKLQIPIKLDRSQGFKGKVTVSGFTPHGEIKIKPLVLEPNQSEGVIEITPTAKAPIGTFAFFARADTQIEYRRNPQTLAKMNQYKVHVEQKLKEYTDALNKAQQAQKDLQAKINQSKTQIEQLTQSLSQAKADDPKRKEVETQINNVKAESDKAAEQAKATAGTIQQQTEMINHAKAAIQYLTQHIKNVTPWNNVIKPRVIFPSNSIHVTVTEK